MEFFVWMMVPSRTYAGEGHYYKVRHSDINRAVEEIMAFYARERGDIPEKIELVEEKEGGDQ